MGIELFLHNETAYKHSLSLMEQTGKAAVIHPTGTGKSFIAFKLAEDHPGSRICWLAPNEYIYRTQLENLNRTAQKSGGQAQDNVLFLTYARLMNADETQIASISPSYIILDEFHRCGAAEWGKGVKRLLDAFPDAKILGLSATNIRYLDNRRNMAEELFDGHIASELTLGEAIVKNILPAPVYVMSLYSCQEELKKWERKVSEASTKGTRAANEEILQKLRRAVGQSRGLDEIFARHMKKTNGKYIVFCSDKEHMEEMKTHTDEWFSRIDLQPHVYSIYYDSASSQKDFDAFKADQSGHLKLLFCIDMLNEGVHVEDIDGVILLRPTISPILYLQQIGRALSAGGCRQPVIFDVVNNFESLCCMDVLTDEIREASMTLPAAPDRGQEFFGKFQIYDEVKDCRKLFLQLKSNLASAWEIYYAAAAEYRNTYGSLRAPKSYVTKDGLALGAWLLTQRRVYAGKRNGRLTGDQIRKLNEIGMVWEIPEHESWERGCEALLAYYRRHGHTDVKSGYVTEEGYALGKWVSNVRQMQKHGALSEEQVKRLDALGMIWDKKAAIWAKHYRAAKQYYDTHRNLRVPASYCTPDGVCLGSWIANLKQVYAGKKKTAAALTKEQIRQMEAIGMEWGSRAEELWQENYALAREYYRSHGNLDVPSDYCVNGVSLGKWIYNQRMRRKSPPSGTLPLTKEQIGALDAVGMIWDKDGWEVRYRIAADYYQANGNLKIAQNYVSKEGVWIGKWLCEQRKRYRMPRQKTPLSAEQIKKLELLGMDWRTPQEAAWEDAFEKAKQYFLRTGNLQVPGGFQTKDGFRLDLWLKRQKSKYRSNTISMTQKEKLEAIGMEWESRLLPLH